MNKLCSLAAFVAIAFQATAQEPEEWSPEELFHAYFEAAEKSDYQTIVDEMHPAILRSFKVEALKIVAAASRKFSKEAVTGAFQGIGDLAQLKEYGEKDFWIYVMENVSADKRWAPVRPRILGKVEDGDYVYLLYRNHHDLVITDEVEKFVEPRCFTFKKHDGHWCYYGYLITDVEKYITRHAQTVPKAGEEPAVDSSPSGPTDPPP